MKAVKTLTLVLALILLTAPLMASKMAAATPVSGGINFEVQPLVNSGFTALATSDTWDLGVPGTAAVGSTFNVTVHLTGATTANAPIGVGGLEVHLNFQPLLAFASIVGFNDYLGQTGGALNAPVLEAVTGAIYQSDGSTKAAGPLYTGGVQYIVAAASTGTPWNGADGLIVSIEFRITSLPTTLQYASDPVIPLTQTFTDLSDATAGPLTHGTHDGTVTFTRTAFTAPANPLITIVPATQTGATTLGAPVNFDIDLTSAAIWDVAGYDVTVSWNSALLSYVGYTDGTFLTMNGDPIFTLNFTSGSPIDQLEVVSTKLTDSQPSSGTATLFTLNLAVNAVGTSYPAATCPIAFVQTDLASWAHPELSIAPWFNSITAVDMPYNATGVAGDGSHQRGPNAVYTEGVISAGAFIDLYDQYPAPYGGQGLNKHSDSFAPQAQVILYANVTYGGSPIANKLVAFQINNALNQKVTILQNYTNANGVATVNFRVPMSDYDIGGLGNGTWDPSIFGTWTVTANVEVDGVVVNDTMSYAVGWLVQVMSVTSNSPSYAKYAGQPMNFTVDVRTIHEQPLTVLVSVDTYDTQGYPIGETSWWVTVSAIRNDTSNSMVPVNYVYGPTTYNGTYYGWGGTLQSGQSPPAGYTPYGPYEVVNVAGSFVYQYIPTWARVGEASVVGYALTALPANGGVPYGPQSNADGTTTTFPITAS